jgi:hypothetical protein
MTDLDEEVGIALNDVWRLVARRCPYEDLVAAFQAVEDTYVPRLEAAGESWEAQETRRRVAEGILGVAIDVGRPLAEYDQIFQRIIDLGFHDVRRELEVSLTYAHGCARAGAHDRVLHCLVPLVEGLALDVERTDDPVLRQLVHEGQEMIRKARANHR